jgi:hypothetical protein
VLVRLSRPLPGGLSTEVNDDLAHRHLDLVIAGMRADPPLRTGMSRRQLTRAGQGS